jgi:hypothetical protein
MVFAYVVQELIKSAYLVVESMMVIPFQDWNKCIVTIKTLSYIFHNIWYNYWVFIFFSPIEPCWVGRNKCGKT